MEEARLIRRIEDDLFVVHLFFECNYLMNIDIEVKDKENVPAIDLQNIAAVSQWCYALWGAIGRAMGRVPEKAFPIYDARKADQRDGHSGYICKQCGVALIQKPPCCGSTKPVLRCPKCGVAYKVPDESTVSAMGRKVKNAENHK
jgi:hypothetical protein